MRQEFDSQQYFDWSIGSRARTVRLYEEKYDRISKILDQNPRLLELAHKDLKPLSKGDVDLGKHPPGSGHPPNRGHVAAGNHDPGGP